MGLVFSLDLRLHNHLKITGGSVSESNLGRLAGVSDPERSEGERESAEPAPSEVEGKSRAQRGNWRKRVRVERTDAGMNQRPPVVKLRRLAGVSDPERSEGERESAAEIPSAARELAEACRSRTDPSRAKPDSHRF